MKTTRIYIIAALLGTLLAGCQIEIEPTVINDNESEHIATLTIQASKIIDTKAMSLAGTTLSAYWFAGEKVAVYSGGTKIGTLTATPGDPNTSATLSGPVDVAGLSAGNHLTLLFPGRDDDQWTYLGQDGSAPSESGNMATKYDYALADLEIASITAGVVEATGTASFVNQQGVYRLGFKVGGAGDPISVDSFTLSASQGKLVRNRTYSGGWVSNYGSITAELANPLADNLYYIALRNDNISNDDVYSFTVIRSSDRALLEGTKNIPSAALDSPRYLTATVSVTQKAMDPEGSGEIGDELEVL